ncbi:MAG: leucine-rich repeat domain-containing protein [Clostridiales bacterium]|jgi:hypothetical protein|nr:leucine-rich repeat domain-containing protein [Clostridiales bacterium]
MIKLFTVEDGVLTGYRSKPKLDVVVLPEGVKKLGAHSLKQFACRKLVMPSTLESIGECAFEDSDINIIDFADCKLDYIGECAFTMCCVKTKRIPDSVRTIGRFGASGLIIGKVKTVRLPSSLRDIGEYAINLYRKYFVEVDEGSMIWESGLYSTILSSLRYRSDNWLQMKVFRKKQIVLEFVISYEFKEISNSAQLIEEKGLNYQLYDEWFDKLSNEQCKQKMAFYRVKWPTDLSDDSRKKYTSYLSMAKLRRYGRRLPEACRSVMEGALLPCHLEECLEDAVRKKDVEMIVYWLELINRKYGGIAKSLEL